MNFIHHDLGWAEAGDRGSVDLPHRANVRLLDEANFARYRRDGRARGVHVAPITSPVFIDIPRSDRWHIAVDLGGAGGRIGSNVQVLRRSEGVPR